MKSSVILAVSLMMTSGAVLASGSSHKPEPKQASSSSRASADANSRSSSKVVVGDVSSKSVAQGGSAKQHQEQYQDQYQEQSVDASGNANVNVNASTNHRRNPVNTAFAPALTSSNDTCMGSSSVGGQGITFGFSFGTTWKDEDCVQRKDARFLHNIQRTEVSLSLMCQKPSVRRAVELAGTRADRIACGLPYEVQDVELYTDRDWREIESRDIEYRSGESG